MAAGGHHPGKLSQNGQMPDSYFAPAQLSQRSSQHDPPCSGSAGPQDDQSVMAAAVAASELAAQESGRLSQHRYAGGEEQEKAMMELAITVWLETFVTYSLHAIIKVL